MEEYEIIAKELVITYKWKVKIIPYVNHRDLVTKNHKEDIDIQPSTEAYIQSLVLKKTI